MLVFVVNVVGSLIVYVGFFAIARFTPNSEELLGLVGFGLGFVGSFFVLTGLGMPAAHVKRISQGEPLSQCIGAFTLMKTLQVGLATFVTLSALYIWTNLLDRGFETPLQQQVIFVMLLYYIAMSTADVGLTTFNARLETAKSQMGILVGTAARVVGVIVVVAAGLGALALAWAYAFGAIAVAFPTVFLLWGYPITRPRPGLIRSYLKFALPLSVPAALVALSMSIDKAFIQLFWGVVQVGYYFTVQRITILLTVITSAVSLLLFPSLSRHHAQNELKLLRTKSRQAERYLTMILAPVVAFLLIYSEGAIHVMLSDDFLPAVNILRLFAVATFIMALIVPRRAILQGMDRPDLTGRAALAGAVTTLALYPILIPTSIFGVSLLGLGPEGAAASIVIGYTVFLALALIFTHRLIGDNIHGRIALHIAAATAIALLFSLLLPPALGTEWRWFHLLAYGTAFLGSYIALLTTLREFRKGDLYLFLDIIDPRKMGRYVLDELRTKNGK